MRILYFIILCVGIFSCSQPNNQNKVILDNKKDSCEGFWFKHTYYSDKKIHTTTLLTKDTVPIKIISYRNNGSVEAEFLFGKERDSLGYGLVIFFDSTELNRIENVEIVGINVSNYWKGNTLFYRKKELMKIDMNRYSEWKRKIDVDGKDYYFDW